jgi:hypothetical protein
VKGKWRPVTRPPFEPQWAERAMEREMEDDDSDGRQFECRLCACTEYSACEGGCYWVEGDLCSSCEELMRAFPLLRLADGYGIAAWHAAAARAGKRYDGRAAGRVAW